jgi:hypothetical protein
LDDEDIEATDPNSTLLESITTTECSSAIKNSGFMGSYYYTAQRLSASRTLKQRAGTAVTNGFSFFDNLFRMWIAEMQVFNFAGRLQIATLLFVMAKRLRPFIEPSTISWNYVSPAKFRAHQHGGCLRNILDAPILSRQWRYKG